MDSITIENPILLVFSLIDQLATPGETTQNGAQKL